MTDYTFSNVCPFCEILVWGCYGVYSFGHVCVGVTILLVVVYILCDSLRLLYIDFSFIFFIIFIAFFFYL